MPFISIEGDVINVGNSETVTIKKRMSRFDRKACEDLAMRGTQELEEGRGKASIDWRVLSAEVEEELIYRNIIAWTIKDGDRVGDLTRENIRRLPDDIAQLILDAIDERNPKQTKEEREKRKKA